VRPIVAIDGPSGAGKSTVARGVAAELGFEVLDTGAMYRAVTLAVLEAGLDPTDSAACAAAARRADIDQRGPVTLLDGRDVSPDIRSDAVTDTVSTVSAHPAVRAVLVERQRRWAAAHGRGVVEGRDIGTVVFPDAVLKAFLYASEAERARRRRAEAEAGERASLDEVQADLDRRDHLDSTRSASPLEAAPDALRIDTTDRTPDDVIDELVAAFRERRGASR
jgi:cytidylate kinase